jgi:hypothetical protein
MLDDAWWDGEDDGHIAELQRALAPLREPAIPWGDVIARARVADAPRSPWVTTLLVGGIAAALTAALVLGWSRGHVDAPQITEPAAPELEPAVAGEPVSDPPRVDAVPPTIVRVPVPVPIEAPSRAQGEPRKPRKKAERKKAAEALVELGEPSPRTELDLPEMLTANEVKTGIAPHRAAAKACGAKHGGERGKSVVIKLTIAGATGLVTFAVAQSPHAGTELGRCVAEVLGKARFPRFRRASMGVMYPVAM